MTFTGKSLRQATIFIYFPSILMSLGMGMLIPALPKLGETFHVSGGWAVQVLTAQLVGRALAVIPAGGAIDRWGTKPVMVAGAVAVLGAGIMAALAPNFWIVALAQFIWGSGTAVWMFGREIAAFDLVAPEQRGRQMSALMGIGSTGMAFGPAVGGFLTDMVGIRPLLWVYAGVALIVLAISSFQPRFETRQLKKGNKFLEIAAIKKIHPFYRMTFLVLFIATFSQMMRTQVVNAALPLYTQDILGMSATRTGLIFTFMAIITFAMILPTGIISDKLGRKWAATPAAVASLVGFVLIPFFTTLPELLLAAVIVGIANGFAMGAMTIYTFDIVPSDYRGQLQAMRRAFGELGSVISPPIVGIMAATWGPSIAFWAIAPLHGISALLLILFARESLRHRLPKGAPAPDEITQAYAGP